MIPDAFRTDHDGTPPEHPSRTELADDLTGWDYDRGEPSPEEQQHRAERVARLAQWQRDARRNWYPHTRCDNRHCRASVDLGDDPMALCDGCGRVTCSGCGSCDCGGGVA